MLYLDFLARGGSVGAERYGGNENLEAVDFLRQLNTAVHRECPAA
jgi:1,4-alpha-glucan branching enzyme